MRPEPQHRLPKQATQAWRISGTLWTIVLWLISFSLAFFSLQAGGPPLWIAIAAGVFTLTLTILTATILPALRWKRWRYQVDEHEVDLRRGIFFIRRTLIPVKRVQHVDTRQGPILRSFGLSSVAITTAATTHEIPALDDETADEVRNQISNFARLAEEDV